MPSEIFDDNKAESVFAKGQPFWTHGVLDAGKHMYNANIKREELMDSNRMTVQSVLFGRDGDHGLEHYQVNQVQLLDFRVIPPPSTSVGAAA